LIWAIKEARKIAQTSPLKESIIEELIPGPEYQSDEDLRDFIMCGPRKYQDGACSRKEQPVNHLAGTSRMGENANDPDTVVTPDLRVVGVGNLRVADASVMPALPSGNPHATCMMIGERGADIIAEEPNMGDFNMLRWKPMAKVPLADGTGKQPSPPLAGGSEGVFA